MPRKRHLSSFGLMGREPRQSLFAPSGEQLLAPLRARTRRKKRKRRGRKFGERSLH